MKVSKVKSKSIIKSYDEATTKRPKNNLVSCGGDEKHTIVSDSRHKITHLLERLGASTDKTSDKGESCKD